MNDDREDWDTPEKKKEERHKELYHWVFVVGGLFLSVVVNFVFLWPISHFFALLLMAAFSALLAFYEMQVRGARRMTILGVVSGLFVFAACVRLAVGPVGDAPKNEPATPVIVAPTDRSAIDREKSIPLEDTQVRGELKPANEPTPPNECDGMPLGPDALKVLIGDNAIAHDGSGRFTVIAIGACDAISMERRPDGIYVNASLYDAEGREVITVKNNVIAALNGEHYTARQSYDGSTVTIRSPQGVELFFIRFLNLSTVRVRGFFGCHNGPAVHVADDHPIPGFFMSHFCLANARTGIQIGPR